MRDATLITIPASTRALLSTLTFLLQKQEWEVIESALKLLIKSLPNDDRTLATQVAERILANQPPGRFIPPAFRDSNSTRLADEIRAFANHTYVMPAREAGESQVSISIKDVHREMGLVQRYPAVKSALQGRLFKESYKVTQMSSEHSAILVFKI